MMAKGGTRPFGGEGTLRVLDVGTQVAGPFATTLLGDFGADVIKCEQPGSGDPIRQPDGLSARWQSDGRNKRSVTVNLRVPRGQELVRRLAAWADVLVENFRPGTMDRWGLGHHDLAKVNSRLVYVSVSGFGTGGPNSDRPGYDPIGASFGGLLHATRDSDGRPVPPGLWVVDHMTGMLAAIGALEAIRRRDRPGGDGHGEWVEIGLYESVLRLTGYEMVTLSQSGALPERKATPPFLTSDSRWVMVFPVGDEQFARLKALIGDPALDDPRFTTGYDRQRHADAYHAVVADWVARHDLRTVLEKVGAADVPCSPVNSFDDLLTDPHVSARRDVVEVENARGKRVTMPAPVPRFGESPGEVRWPGEELGASNEDVYVGLLGLDQGELDQLRSDGVI